MTKHECRFRLLKYPPRTSDGYRLHKCNCGKEQWLPPEFPKMTLEDRIKQLEQRILKLEQKTRVYGKNTNRK